MPPVEGVEGAGQTARPAGGVGQHQFGQGQAFIGGQAEHAGVRVNAHHQPYRVHGGLLGCGQEAAGIHQVQRPPLALFLPGVGAAYRQQGIVHVAGKAAAGSHADPAGTQRRPVGHALPGPGPVKGGQVKFALGQFQAAGQRPGQFHRPVAFAAEFHPPGDHVVIPEQGVEQIGPQPQHLVPAVQDQGFAVVGAAAAGGQTGRHGLARQDLPAFQPQVGAAAALCIPGDQAGFPQIAGAERGIFHRHHRRRKLPVDGIAGAARPQQIVQGLAGFQPGPEIQMAQPPVGQLADGIADGTAQQVKLRAGVVYKDGHYFPSAMANSSRAWAGVPPTRLISRPWGRSSRSSTGTSSG